MFELACAHMHKRTQDYFCAHSILFLHAHDNKTYLELVHVGNLNASFFLAGRWAIFTPWLISFSSW